MTSKSQKNQIEKNIRHSVYLYPLQHEVAMVGIDGGVNLRRTSTIGYRQEAKHSGRDSGIRFKVGRRGSSSGFWRLPKECQRMPKILLVVGVG
jgi:hypothetical protein